MQTTRMCFSRERRRGQKHGCGDMHFCIHDQVGRSICTKHPANGSCQESASATSDYMQRYDEITVQKEGIRIAAMAALQEKAQESRPITAMFRARGQTESVE